MYVWVCTCYGMCIEVRGQFMGVGSLPPFGLWKLNSGHWTWQQAPLPAEPCHWPRSRYFPNIVMGTSGKFPQSGEISFCRFSSDILSFRVGGS